MSISSEVAERVVADVEAGQHICAFRMNGRSRAAAPLYSLGSLAAFLRHDDACVDPEGLVEWVGQVVGDTELAAAIAEANRSRDNNYERIRAAEWLVNMRVSQARSHLE